MHLTNLLPALLITIAGLACEQATAESETPAVYVRAHSRVHTNYPANSLQSRSFWKRCADPNSDGTCDPDPTCKQCTDCIDAGRQLTVSPERVAVSGCTIGCDTSITCSNPCGGNYIPNISCPDDFDPGSQCDLPPGEEKRSTPEKRDATKLTAFGLKRNCDKRC